MKLRAIKRVLFVLLVLQPAMAWGKEPEASLDKKNTKAPAHVYEERWNWDQIDINQVKFPKDFLWGAAICEFQNSGAACCSESQWAHWEKTQQLEPSGNCCDSWNLYQKDIDMLTELGLNCYRFSIDWSKIEPRAGEFDQTALQHYVEMCDALDVAGIKPVVTLHHFVHPQWFEELGAFEKAENTKYFVEFSKRVFIALGNRVELWSTFNEPAIYTMQGYVRGVYPPGVSGYFGVKRAAKVLRNILNAHVEVYHALKALPGGKEAKIGIVHQYLKFEPFTGKQSKSKAGLERFIASQFDWVHKTVIDFFKTGLYHFKVTGIVNMHDDIRTTNSAVRKQRIDSLDYIGLNYYSHVFLQLQNKLAELVKPTLRCYDIPTGMPFGVYAEGFYQAIQHMAELNKPIYITENGAPTPDEACRDTWIKRYLYALSKALEDGYDVRGYIYWTLMDNYEWDMGTEQKFGLCTIDAATQERVLKPGSEHFQQIVANATGRKSPESPQSSWFSRAIDWFKRLFN